MSCDYGRVNQAASRLCLATRENHVGSRLCLAKKMLKISGDIRLPVNCVFQTYVNRSHGQSVVRFPSPRVGVMCAQHDLREGTTQRKPVLGSAPGNDKTCIEGSVVAQTNTTSGLYSKLTETKAWRASVRDLSPPQHAHTNPSREKVGMHDTQRPDMLL